MVRFPIVSVNFLITISTLEHTGPEMGTDSTGMTNDDHLLSNLRGGGEGSSPPHVFTSQCMFGTGKKFKFKFYNFVRNVCFVLKHELSENNVSKFICFRA